MREAAQAHGLQRGQDSAVHLGALDADLFHRECDFVLDVGGKQLRLEILKDHADLGRDVADAKMLEWLAGDADRAVKIAVLEFRNDAIEAFREGGFAGARRAHHADHLAGVLRETHRSKRGAVGAVISECHSLNRHCVLAGIH